MARKILVIVDEDYLIVKKYNEVKDLITLQNEEDFTEAGFTEGVVYQVSDKPFTSGEPGIVLEKDDLTYHMEPHYAVPGKRKLLIFCSYYLKEYFVDIPEKLYVREVWD